MKNIFENARFGDKFLTRDGRIACIQCFCADCVCMFTEDICYTCNFDGTDYACETCNDIVSEWQEPINEEELDKLAEEYVTKYATPHTSQFVDMTNGFKAGYRKAKE